MPRLKTRYQTEIHPALKKKFGYENVQAVPKLSKIVLNMGVGDATEDIKRLESAAEELTLISGQRAATRRAKKSIASFKVREGQPVGCRVTLRGVRMYEFLDRLVSTALPRVRDFRGISRKSFDGRGNYTMGIRDEMIFLELSHAKVEKVRGFNLTLVTTARTDEESLALLELFGMPFRKV
ncbi:MAG: 50S ribosomal protein L5 [Acidobacteriota bacterium]